MPGFVRKTWNTSQVKNLNCTPTTGFVFVVAPVRTLLWIRLLSIQPVSSPDGYCDESTLMAARQKRPGAAGMSREQLRDMAKSIVHAVAQDMRVQQSEQTRHEKSL